VDNIYDRYLKITQLVKDIDRQMNQGRFMSKLCGAKKIFDHEPKFFRLAAEMNFY